MHETEVYAAGSSPLTRGAPPIDHAELMRIRLIPAHAGSTYRQL